MASRKRRPAPVSVACSFAEYQALPGLNWSSLKHIAKSPAHFQHAKSQPPEDTASMMAGRAAHAAILEPDRFPLDFAVWTGARRAGADWEAFQAANTGRTIIKAEEYRVALAQRDAVQGHRAAARILTGGEPERTLTWTDPETGIGCKGRVDYLRPDGAVDVKTTSNLDRRRFAAQAFDLLYHCQLAFYRRGLVALGMADPRFWIVAVESSAPYDVAPLEVDPGVIATGDEKVGELLRLFAECTERRRWPGRYPDVETFHLPGYAYTSDEDEGGDLGLVVAELQTTNRE